MAIRILRTLMLYEAVGADGELRRRVPVFRGQRLLVHPVYDECADYDWLAPVEGGVLPLPPGSWVVDASLTN